MSSKGLLRGIAVRPDHDIPLRELQTVSINEERGLVGDHIRRRGKRQVTVLTTEGWEAACRELGVTLPWTTRRANLLVSGLSLTGSTGAHLHVGEVILELTGETQPCDNMEAAFAGLRAALTPGWRGGVTCRVIRGGVVTLNDEVTLVQEVV